MRHSKFLFLLIGVTFLFFSCSKDNSPLTDDQATSSLKSKQLTFEGTSTLVAPISPGTETPLPNGKVLIEGQTAEWYELSDEPLVTGQSIWNANWLNEADGTAEIWGTTVIYVGLASGGDPADAEGEWEMIWHGWLTSDLMIEVEAVGTGVSGIVEGMTAQWTYTLDLSTGVLIYDCVGSIKSKPVTKIIKFNKSSGVFEFVEMPCCGDLPYLQARIIGEGNASHIGHFTVLNTYCLISPEYTQPIGPWLGFITAANGDEINTQMTGFGYDPDIGPFYIYTIIGGTGRFDGATGELRMWGESDLNALTWSLEGEGEITY